MRKKERERVFIRTENATLIEKYYHIWIYFGEHNVYYAFDSNELW